MYIQHAHTEITKNHIYVSILHWQSITECWHRHTQTSHKVKTFFSMHVVIYTLAVAVKIKPKNTQTNTQNKYMMYRSIQSNKEYLRQRIMGGKGGGGEKKKKKNVFLVKSLVWKRKN